MRAHHGPSPGGLRAGERSTRSRPLGSDRITTLLPSWASSIGDTAEPTFCADLWALADLEGASIQVTHDWQKILTESDIEGLKRDYMTLNADYVMAFTATNTCNGPVEIGFSGGGDGWLTVTIERGGATFYRVEGPCLSVEAEKAYSIRSGGNGCGGGTLTLSNIELHPVACAPTQAPTLTQTSAPTSCCVVPKDASQPHSSQGTCGPGGGCCENAVRAAWYEFSTIAFSDSATAIKSEGKNFYASMATPGGTAPATSTFEVGKCGGAASFGLTAQGSRNGQWQFDIPDCQAALSCWEDTGFVQQDFIDYANQLIPGVHNGVAVRKFLGSTKMQATNDDCNHWGNLPHGDDEEVMCVLVFPDHTGTITVDKYDVGGRNPQKPAFAILAPQATVIVANGAGRVHGAIVAYDIDIRDAGAQMHGWWIGPDNYSNDGDDLPCSCEGD